MGLHSVREALRARRRRLVHLRIEASERGGPPRAIRELVELAEGIGVATTAVDSLDEVLHGLGSDHRGPSENPQRVALEVGPLPRVPLAELVAESAPPGDRRLLVVLDEIQDPQNLGAIARVADAAGALGLVIPERRSVRPTPAASRASAGALEWLPVASVGNLSTALDALAEAGFWSLGTLPDADSTLYELPDRIFEADLAVVMGGEGPGIRPSLRKRLDHAASLPMRGAVASLNVSTAAAATLFEVRRRWQRGADPKGHPGMGEL